MYHSELNNERERVLKAVKPEPNVMATVTDTLNDASGLAQAIINLANRLLGAVPEPVGSETAEYVSDAVFPQLKDHARTVASEIRSANAAIVRIQQEIP